MMKKAIITTDDFTPIQEQDENLLTSTKTALDSDKFYATLPLKKRVEYYLYKKLKSLMPHGAIALLTFIMIALWQKIDYDTIMTVVNFTLLLVNLLFVSGRKIQEQKDEEEKWLHLSLEYQQTQQEKHIIDYLDEILTILKDKDKDITKF